MGVILKELCLLFYIFIVKVAPDLHARQCGGSKAHCSSADLLPAQSFASMTWEKMHLENGRSLEPNPIQVHLELGSILGGKASLLQMKICAPETYIRLNNRGKRNPQLSSEIRVTETERERSKELPHKRCCQYVAKQLQELVFLNKENTYTSSAMQCNATRFRLASTGASTPQQFYSTRSPEKKSRCSDCLGHLPNRAQCETH
jgi:hypothetical protein